LRATDTAAIAIDRTAFSIEPFARIITKPWGREIHLVAEGAPYMAKIIEISDGHRLSFQLHDKKTETWTLLSGEASVLLEDEQGELHEISLEIGVGYSCAIGQKHRLIGKKDGRVFEASTPEIGVTVRLEDDYRRPDETEELRQSDRAGS
jgi:mannose-6-phosphate isomerase